VDYRVRSLMMTVKQWAKEHKINSAKEKCISSYTWMNLVIFYLQCIGFIPNLQSPILSKAAGIVSDPDKNYWHFVNRLDTFYLRWEVVRDSKIWAMPNEFDELPLSILLYGFFEFYSSRFPFGTHAVSIKRGNISLSKLSTRKIGLFFSIEDPFETYDSHCPHDLGTPANEYGSKKIMDCFRNAEDHLRNNLCSDKKPTDDRLWPKPEFVEPEPTRSNARRSKSGFKRFERPAIKH
jgi:DNA polymerase sigma